MTNFDPNYDLVKQGVFGIIDPDQDRQDLAEISACALYSEWRMALINSTKFPASTPLMVTAASFLGTERVCELARLVRREKVEDFIHAYVDMVMDITST